MEILYKKWPLSLFREEMTNKTNSKPLKTRQQQQRPTHDNNNTDVVIIYSLSVPGGLFRLFLSSKILTSYDLLCCSVGARVELRGREHVNANVCGVADEAGGYGECGDIRLFLHRSKNTHLLLSVSKTKAVGVRPAGKERGEGVLARGGASSL